MRQGSSGLVWESLFIVPPGGPVFPGPPSLTRLYLIFIGALIPSGMVLP